MLNNIIFEFCENPFILICGIMISTEFAPIYAKLSMAVLKENIFKNRNTNVSWRHIGETFLFQNTVKCWSRLIHFIQLLNLQHISKKKSYLFKS